MHNVFLQTTFILLTDLIIVKKKRKLHGYPFFDPVTYDQMEDTATNFLVCQKSTLLSELFSVELQFTTDTLVKWFNCTFKSKFLVLGEI